jgi:hypothetical protein
MAIMVRWLPYLMLPIARTIQLPLRLDAFA